LTYHLASLPLLALDLDGVQRDRAVSKRLRTGTDPSPDLVRVLSRVPFIVLTCWGAALLYLWALEAAGPLAALLAVALYTLSPTMLAYGPLAHSDITVSIFFLQTAYTLWRWLERPGTGRLVACGLSLGLALAAKVSALLLLPAIGIVLAIHAVRRRVDAAAGTGGVAALSSGLAGAWITWTAMLVPAVFVVWLSYGGSFASSEGIGGRFADVTLPAYLHSLLFDVGANAHGRVLYFFGQYSEQGWWYFFPVVFAVKTPIATLLLLGLALATRRRGLGSLYGVVATVTAVYVAVACFWLRVPLGLRYVLPVIPLMHLLIAVRLVPATEQWRRIAVAAGVVWLAGTGLLAHPHYISYANALVGGSAGAHRYIVESNLDWGQDLPALARYLDERGNPPVQMAYFGPEDPAHYGIQYTRLDRCKPATGLVAISATIARRVYAPWNPFRSAPEGCYDWLLRHDPVAQPGNSILVYDVPEQVD